MGSGSRTRARRLAGPSIVVRTLQMLAKRGEIDPSWPARAAQQYQLLNVNAGSSGATGGDA